MDLTWEQKFKFEDRAFFAILFFASKEGTQSLPNKEANLLLFLAAAVVEYLGGDRSKIPLGAHPYNHRWWSRVNEEVNGALNRNTKNLDAVLLEFFKTLLNIEWKTGHGESWWESGVRSRIQFLQRGYGQTFCLSHPVVLGIQENIKSHIAPADVEHCKQIGLLMRKNILEATAAAK